MFCREDCCGVSCGGHRAGVDHFVCPAHRHHTMTTLDPTTLEPLGIRRRLGRGNWSTPERFGPDGWRWIELAGRGSVIATVAPCGEDNADWIHASLAWVDHIPSYGDLKWLHAAVFNGGWAYQVFAPPTDHVNIHEYALHLWGRVDGLPGLPDFVQGLGSV